MSNARTYKLFLFGPLRLISPAGDDITPAGGKVQGLLALLATPPGRIWSRSALQDKLWSDRDQKRGRDSLKKALSVLRSVFVVDDGVPLSTRGQIVYLDAERIRVDFYDQRLRDEHLGPQLPEFLEGSDVNDPEFEDWLRSFRSSIEEAPHLKGATAHFAPLETENPTRLRIALLPTAADLEDVPSSILGDLIVDRIAIALRHQDLFEVCDFRSTPDKGEGRGADVLLQLRLVRLNQDLVLSISVRDVSSNRMVWAEKRVIGLTQFGATEVASLVCDFVDLMADAILRPGALSDGQQRSAARHAMDAVDLMFRIDRPDLAKSSTALKTAIEINPRGPYLALFAYQTLFRLEAAKGQNTPELRERADELIARALEADPYNPISRSLLAHVYSFLFRDFERADQLLATMRSSPPDSPFYFHSLAALRVYTGRLDDAYEAARQSAALARFNPYSYAFTTALSMVETIRGNFSDAIRHGEKVVCLHRNSPRIYEPALRYLAAAYAHKRDEHNARRIVDLIRRQSPDFSLRSLRDKQYPIPSDHAREVILTGLSTISGTDL